LDKLPHLFVEDRSARRIKSGYPWLFNSEITNAKELKELPAGQIVDIIGKKGEFVARAFFNPKTQLAARVLTLNSIDNIDEDFIFNRIEKALVYRESLYSKPFYRLIHAESDSMPGLIIDRYGDVVVCQVNTAGMQSLWSYIEAAINKLIKPKAIILKNDNASREMEGLEASGAEVIGSLSEGDFVNIIENEVAFSVDVIGGQKTGWFFDQRENRAWIASLTKEKSFIDVFCHTGGFGITAAKLGANSVVFVDSSAPALEMVKRNAKLNKVEDKCTTVEGRAFDVLEKLRAENKLFDVVSVDPPAFIKTRKDMNTGMKGYKKLAKLSAPIVNKGGILFFASCSHHADISELLKEVSEGIAASGRQFQLIKTSGAAPDHPVLPNLPETGYLKGFTFRFLD